MSIFCVGMNEREILKKVLSPESQQTLKKKKKSKIAKSRKLL